ncbi:hypothetical protein BgiMline_010549 [Biomphalaria glabrata]|nr:hypothetical protein BgiMline_024265 [Biomphalaria glabrata]
MVAYAPDETTGRDGGLCPRRDHRQRWWPMPQTRPQAEMVAYAPDETTGRDGGLCPRRDHRQRWWPMPQTRTQAELR